MAEEKAEDWQQRTIEDRAKVIGGEKSSILVLVLRGSESQNLYRLTHFEHSC